MPARYRTASLLLAFASSILAAAASAPATVINPGDIFVLNNFIGGTSSSSSLIRVDPMSGAQTVISSSALLTVSHGLGWESSTGDLLVANQASTTPGNIVRVNPTTGIANIAASGGLISNAVDVVVAANGDMLVLDSGPTGVTPSVIRVPAVGPQTYVTTGGLLVTPSRIILANNGDILVSDLDAAPGGQGAVIRINPSGGLQAFVSRGVNLRDPTALVLESNGNILVADRSSPTFAGGVYRVDPTLPASTPQVLVSSLNTFADLIGGMDLEANGKIIVGGIFNPGTFDDGVTRVDPMSGLQTPLSLGGNFTYAAGDVLIPPGVPEPTAALSLVCAGFASVLRRPARRLRVGNASELPLSLGII